MKISVIAFIAIDSVKFKCNFLSAKINELSFKVM